ncbi:hypothetical protein NKH33_30890 [Mesorhizobium sp. M1182]|uniref:hypothetical protein n=1 Tax=Mesorhizobium sp. M1182 TaxID=2957067 RepID=UPI00333DE422
MRSEIVEDDDIALCQRRSEPRFDIGFEPRHADVGTILLAGQQLFFEAIAIPDEPARDRGRCDLDVCSSGQLGGKLRHGDVILLGHTAKQERTMRVELGMAAATAGLRRQALGLSIVPHQDHDKRNRLPKCAAAARRE